MKPTNLQAILYTAAIAAAPTTSPDDASSTIHWSPKPSAGNATTVDKGYIGFGIEMKSFPDYAGRGDTPNAFSNFLLQQISNRTGGAPLHIRVGGTSMDNTRYNPALTTEAVNITGNFSACKLHTDVDIGAPWLRSFKNLGGAPAALAPRYTVQVPLARKDVDNGVAFASACIDALDAGDTGLSRLDALEIGNEPNFYPDYPKAPCRDEADRAKGWRPSNYTDEWTKYAAELAGRVGALKRSGVKEWFQTLTLSSTVQKQAEWGLSAIGDELTDGGYVKTVSQHYYQGNASKGLKEELLTHSTTVSRIQGKFAANLAFAKNRSIPFILGEVGSAIGADGKANPALYDTLGAALWTLDFLLYGMTIGIARVSMQLGTNFRISAWQPVDKPPNHPQAVHGNYYGLVAGAAFIGGGGDLQVSPLDAVDGHPDVVGYAGYHGGRLSKIAVLNLDVWNGGNTERPAKHISLSRLGDDVNEVRVSRLTAPLGATADTGITWAGRRWTAENNGTEYADGERPVTIGVQDGAPARNIVVKASEAVVVEILRG
ncbi:putative glycoside hydrolase family 79 protein [Lasiodiplodia theobromae]|uniref:Glycoside hydrolase family 79 protein n=1 Tax=Lasiodiplodia theobromae TaxID=45133 RepID=A0A8H7MAZ1_9PEZI|nr:putative glycoside hydrolase family 79 protein [Lasiodiplodia theobromae]